MNEKNHLRWFVFGAIVSSLWLGWASSPFLASALAQVSPFASVPEAKLAQWYNARLILSAVAGVALGLIVAFIHIPRLALTGSQQNVNRRARRIFLSYLVLGGFLCLVGLCFELALANPLKLAFQLSFATASTSA